LREVAQIDVAVAVEVKGPETGLQRWRRHRSRLNLRSAEATGQQRVVREVNVTIVVAVAAQ